jgi:hypothetical protein
VEQHPTSLYPMIDWLYASESEAVVAARGGHIRYWTPQISILHDNFCLSMICSDNDVEEFYWYCLICYAHMNLNYTIFVVFFYSLCKKYWASNPVSFLLLTSIYVYMYNVYILTR